MQRFFDLNREFEWEREDSVECKQASRTLEVSKVEPKANEKGAPIKISFCRKRLKHTSVSSNFVDDIYELLQPFVSDARAQGGLILRTEAFAFKPLDELQRLSQQKSRIDIVKIQQEGREKFKPDSDGVVKGQVSISQAHAFLRLESDLSAMLNLRGLLLQGFLEKNLVKWKDTEFRLADGCLSSCFILANNFERDGLTPILGERDELTQKWLDSVKQVQDQYPLRVNGVHNFETRQNYQKKVSLGLEIKQRSSLVVFDKLVQLGNNYQASSLYPSFSLVKPLWYRSDWKIENLDCLRTDNGEDFVEIVERELANVKTQQVGISFKLIWCDEGIVVNFMKIVRKLGEFYFLQELIIDVSACNFEDQCCKYICYLLQNSKCLRSLNLVLDQTQFTDSGIISLAEGISTLSLLSSLSLDFGFSVITNYGVSHIAKAISVLKDLKSLTLGFASCVRITSSYLDELAVIPQNCTKLTEVVLDLRNNRISPTAVKQAFNSFESLKNLVRFSVGLRGVNANIVTAVSALESVTELSLDLGGIPDEHMISLSEAIQGKKRLSSINISLRPYTNITDFGLSALLNGISTILALSELDLNFMSPGIVSSKTLESLGGLLKKCSSIATLNFQFQSTNHSNSGFFALSEGLRALKQAKHISLTISKDSISDETAALIVNAISHQRQLSKLVLCFPMCGYIRDRTFQGICSILNCNSSISKLEISLSETQFSDDAAKMFASGLNSLVDLTEILLDISQTNVSENGVICVLDCLLSLGKLRRLNLVLNHLSLSDVIGDKIATLLRHTEIINFSLFGVQSNISALAIENIQQIRKTRNFKHFLVKI
eukprot:TRINITY_DN3492_c0_g1_i12.p1 TRINITY_DN3492_c0_g1~~TRINITY_DN3492_c0_g1_i12.p1  ORF type:complete len:832 (-),score=90.67 TRINITY_DN3492_c0_g1_i12:50-2545(-)